ncbi:Myb-like DNA-binding domain protein [Aspergillus lucknowensis]|uniref:Myb-like DNA-binding domain protein n=1 Tax=Aspergillus lucknowensis TaxID=176173 RepID=A0ABR4LZR9_9EURO
MEGPLKRRRLPPSCSPRPESDDGSHEVDIQEARAQNDLRLKSIFEDIFEKYGRDFTDVGDEIDLQTGKILVNNGHIHALEGRDNADTIGDWLTDPETSGPPCERGKSTSNDNSRHRLDSRPPESRRAGSRLSQLLLGPEKPRETTDEGVSTTSEAEDDRSSVDSLLDSALCVQNSRTRESGMSSAVTEKAISSAAGSNHSQQEHPGRLDETVDPIWRVPAISANLTTPTLPSRSRPRPPANTVRSQSPPGGGSLWALPSRSRRRTDVMKRRKQKNSPKKQKRHQSSPIICDWSFADTPDGTESDDPLQENYEPSPTLKGAVYIREKRKNPLSANRMNFTHSYRKRSFSQESYVPHSQAVLSGPADNKHDLIDLERQLTTAPIGCAPESAPALDKAPRSIMDASAPNFKSNIATNESSSTGKKRARTTIGPGEARLIVQLRQVQGMKWKDILDHFPQKNLAQLLQWNHSHWNERRVNPPRLSAPWSKVELVKLDRLKDQPDLTWSGIRAELPGRSHAEIEFELLQLWAGEDVGSTSKTSLLRATSDE